MRPKKLTDRKLRFRSQKRKPHRRCAGRDFITHSKPNLSGPARFGRSLYTLFLGWLTGGPADSYSWLWVKAIPDGKFPQASFPPQHCLRGMLALIPSKTNSGLSEQALSTNFYFAKLKPDIIFQIRIVFYSNLSTMEKWQGNSPRICSGSSTLPMLQSTEKQPLFYKQQVRRPIVNGLAMVDNPVSVRRGR